MTQISWDTQRATQGWLSRAIALSQNGWYEAAIACLDQAESTAPEALQYRRLSAWEIGTLRSRDRLLRGNASARFNRSESLVQLRTGFDQTEAL